MKENSFEKQPEREEIKSTAILYKGEIFTGPTHGHAFGELLKSYPDCKSEEVMDDDGFITTSGRYVAREEAVKIAQAAKQIFPQKNKPDKEILSSEDVQRYAGE